MTATGNASRQVPHRRRHAVSAIAGGLVAVLGGAAIASSGGGAAGASTTYTTHSSGRFLSGTIAGNNLDVVAGIEGESATNPHGGARVVNQNSLNAELLNGAIKIPLQDGLQLPGLNVLHLGAVAQYAEADPSGRAIGAAGAVADNGGIGVGGTHGVPADATLDLSGLGGSGAGQLGQLLNVKAVVGAISAHAQQATGANGKQTGTYEIAGLRLEVDLPFLADLLKPVLDAVSPLLDTLTSTINGLPLGGAIQISLPSLSKLLKQLGNLSLLDGGVTVNLNTGTIVVDVAKILQAIGLDLNNLPPNTSLVPYIIDALTHSVPQAISALVNGLVSQISDLVGQIKITVGGQPITKVLFNTLVKPLITTLTNTLSSTLSSILDNIDVSGALAPIFDLLSKILEIIVNGQSTSNGVFTEQALLLKLGSGTGFTLPPLPITTVRVPSSKIHSVQSQIRTLARQEEADAQQNGGAASGAPSSSESPNVAAHTRLATGAVHARTVHAVRPGTLAAAPVNALVSLALATATVGPANPVNGPTPTPTTSTSVPATNIPTGVPAGSGTHGENITLPLVLVLLGLVLAGGGAYAYRGRGKFGA